MSVTEEKKKDGAWSILVVGFMHEKFLPNILMEVVCNPDTFLLDSLSTSSKSGPNEVSSVCNL